MSNLYKKVNNKHQQVPCRLKKIYPEISVLSKFRKLSLAKNCGVPYTKVNFKGFKKVVNCPILIFCLFYDFSYTIGFQVKSLVLCGLLRVTRLNGVGTR